MVQGVQLKAETNYSVSINNMYYTGRFYWQTAQRRADDIVAT